MFRNSYQNGLLSIFYSCGSQPLRLWSKNVKNGYVKRVTDDQVKSLVLELVGNNVVSTYIACPPEMNESLGIKLPFLILIVKNLKKYFTFEIQILDDRKTKRRFRVSNYASATKIRQFDCSMPISLNPGWNQIYFNLQDFTRRAYGTSYVECTRIQILDDTHTKRKFNISNAATQTKLGNFETTIPVNLNPGWNQIQFNMVDMTKRVYGTKFMECTRVHIHANCRLRRVYFSDRLYADEELPKQYKLYVDDILALKGETQSEADEKS